MDARSKLDPDGVPTHCHYSKCVNPVEQPGVGRRRFYCCDAHRLAANQESRSRSGRAAALVSPSGRHVAYGDSVLSVHQQLRTSVQGLHELAERLAQALTQAGDVRAAQSLVDQAESALEHRERELVTELNAEIQARIVALDQVEQAREETSAALTRAETAESAQVAAESALEQARAEFTEARTHLEHRLSVADNHAARARADAEEARAAGARAEGARQELSARHAAEIERLREQQRDLRADLTARIEVAQRVADERTEQLRLARIDIEQRESLAREQREVLEARIRSLEEVSAARGRELERIRDEAAREREQFQLRLAQEVLRSDARVREVREDLNARMQALESVGQERATALASCRAQLEQAMQTTAKHRT